MPLNMADLQDTLKEMKNLHIAGRRGSYNQAVRTQQFIRKLHSYAIREFARVGIKKTRDIDILTEKKILGSFKQKNVDILVLHKITGAMIIVSVKSLMSAITSNFTNTFEAMIGDASTMHERYPYLIMTELFLFPKEVLNRSETYPLDYYSNLLSKINKRQSQIDDNKKYERIGLVVADFNKTPLPTVYHSPKESKDLYIETFFDDVKKIYEYRYEDLL